MNNTNSTTDRINTFTPKVHDQVVLIAVLLIIFLVGLAAIFDALLFGHCECTDVNTLRSNEGISLYALRHKTEDKPNNIWESSKKNKNNPNFLEFYIEKRDKVTNPHSNFQLVDLSKNELTF